MSTVGSVSAAEGVQKVTNSNNENKNKTSNTVDMTGKTEEYKKTLETIQKNKDEVLAALQAKIEAPNTTNAQRKELEAKLETLKNVYKHTNYKISPNGNITFSFTKDTNINVEDFKEAYGLKDGRLRQYLSKRHSEEVASGYTLPEGANNEEEAQELLEGFRMAEVGESITFSDGFKLTKGRSWLGRVTDVPDYSNMRFEHGDEFTLNLGDI